MVAAIAFGLFYIHPASILIALAAAGGVAIFNRITNAQERAPEQFSISVPKYRRREKSKIPPSHRIPGL